MAIRDGWVFSLLLFCACASPEPAAAPPQHDTAGLGARRESEARASEARIQALAAQFHADTTQPRLRDYSIELQSDTALVLLRGMWVIDIGTDRRGAYVLLGGDVGAPLRARLRASDGDIRALLADSTLREEQGGIAVIARLSAFRKATLAMSARVFDDPDSDPDSPPEPEMVLTDERINAALAEGVLLGFTRDETDETSRPWYFNPHVPPPRRDR